MGEGEGRMVGGGGGVAEYVQATLKSFQDLLLPPKVGW